MHPTFKESIPALQPKFRRWTFKYWYTESKYGYTISKKYI